MVQKPFSVGRCDPKWIQELFKSSKILQKIKTIAWEEPLETSENTIERRKTQENSENRAIGGLNSECTGADGSSRSTVQIRSENRKSAVTGRGNRSTPHKTCDGDQQSQRGPSIKSADRRRTLHHRIAVGKYK